MDEVAVDHSLVGVVEALALVVEAQSQSFANEAPVPGLEDVILIAFRIREDEAILIGVVLQPQIGHCFVEASKFAASAGGDEVNSRAKLMLGVALVGRELIGCAHTIEHRVLAF